jgi:hypothetical protein
MGIFNFPLGSAPFSAPLESFPLGMPEIPEGSREVHMDS